MAPSPLLPFDIDAFLPPGSAARRIARFNQKQIIFSHGDHSTALFYIEKGCVKLTVTCRRGREAIVGLFDRGHLFGESCLDSNQPLHFGSAVALTDIEAVKIDRKAAVRVLRTETRASYSFVKYLIARDAQVRRDLVHSLLQSSEERLARVLCMLAQSETIATSEASVKVSQQTLAEMIGTTRQRVNFLMQRFRKLGFIEDANGLKVGGSLLELGRTTD